MGMVPTSIARFFWGPAAFFLTMGTFAVPSAWAESEPSPSPGLGPAARPVAGVEVREEAVSSAESAAEAEAKSARRERIVAFARQRVREMAERKRAAERDAKKAHRVNQPSRLVHAPRSVPAKPGLPEIVDHRSALERQLAANWGWGADRDRQVRVPLPDWKNWQGVRLFGIDHLAAFRYTKQHHALTVAFAVETTAQRPSSLSCMDTFERRGMPELERHSVHIESIEESASRWDERRVLVHKTEGRVTFLFSRYEFSAAWTAYPAYDHGCLVYATVVLWDGQPALARQLLDRFVAEGVGQVRPLTSELPGRKPAGPAPVPAPRAARLTETAQSRR